MRWDTRYVEHPLWADARAGMSLLEKGSTELKVYPRDTVDHLRFVLVYLEELGKAYQPLISTSSLNGCHQAVIALVADLRSWVENDDPQYLESAGANRLEAVLEAMRGWPIAKDRYARGVIASAEAVSAAADHEIESLRSTVQQMTEELAEVEAALDAASRRVQELERDFQGRADSVAEAITKQTLRLDEALNGIQANFTNAEVQRASEHSAMLSELKATAESAREAEREAWVNARTEAKGEAFSVLRELEEQLDQARNVNSAVGLTATSSSYQQYAERERLSADRWRIVAAASFGLAFAVYLLMLFAGLGGSVSGETPWQVVVFKITGSAGLLALGLYAGRESRSHRESERRAKSVQLDLAALEPFIANMNEEQQQAVRLGAAQRLFASTGRERDPRSAPQEDRSELQSN